MSLRIDLVYMYAVVFAMVVKPTTDDGWTIAIVAALLVASTAVFLTPSRSTMRRRLSSYLSFVTFVGCERAELDEGS